MRLGWNLLAGLTNSAWTALIGVLATPFYLHYLGIESYGLIGFFTTLLTLLQLLDLGLSPTMNREAARHAAVGDLRGVRHLLRSLELVYWAAALLLCAFFVLAAGLIGRHWLRSTHLASADVVHALMLMGLVIAVRWPVGLYAGTLMGAQRLAIVSGISIIMVTVGAVGSIVVLATVSPTIQAFFLWQAGIGLLYVFVMRRAAWMILRGGSGIGFKLNELRRIWRFSAGLGAIAVTGVILMQIDKLLLSRMVGLGAYGRYMLASLLASGLYLLVTPIFNVLYPRFSALVAGVETEHIAELYGLATRLVATLVFPVAIAIALFSEPMVQLWTHDMHLAAQVAPILSLLILGSALHGIMYLPYALQLAYGKARLALVINMALLAIYLPLIVALTLIYGEIGAALAWLLLHCCYVGLGTWLTHRHFLKGHGSGWLVRDVGIPFFASLLVGMVVSKIVYRSSNSGYLALFCACVVVIGSALLSLALSPALRLSLVENLSLKLHKSR